MLNKFLVPAIKFMHKHGGALSRTNTPAGNLHHVAGSCWP